MGLFKNQRGFAPIMIVLIVAVLAVAGGAYYFVSQKDKDDSGTSNRQAAAECTRAIDDKDLCKLAANSDFGGNYTMTLTGTQDGQAMTWVVKSDGGNTHTLSTSDGQTAEFIMFDGSTYAKDPATGKWTKYPSTASADESDEVTGNVQDDLDFTDEEAVYYTKVGKESCGSLTCFHYSYNNPAEPDAKHDFWFDDKEYKIRKITSTQAGETSEMLFTYGDAKVSAPAEYEELPAFDGGMSEEQLQQLMEQYAN